MPVTKSAKRALRKSLRRRQRNLYHLRRMREAVRKFKRELMSLTPDEWAREEVRQKMREMLNDTISIIFHVAGKHVIHKNEASRRVSRLTKLFNKVTAELEKKATQTQSGQAQT